MGMPMNATLTTDITATASLTGTRSNDWPTTATEIATDPIEGPATRSTAMDAPRDKINSTQWTDGPIENAPARSRPLTEPQLIQLPWNVVLTEEMTPVKTAVMTAVTNAEMTGKKNAEMIARTTAEMTEGITVETTAVWAEMIVAWLEMTVIWAEMTAEWLGMIAVWAEMTEEWLGTIAAWAEMTAE